MFLPTILEGGYGTRRNVVVIALQVYGRVVWLTMGPECYYRKEN